MARPDLEDSNSGGWHEWLAADGEVSLGPLFSCTGLQLRLMRSGTCKGGMQLAALSPAAAQAHTHTHNCVH